MNSPAGAKGSPNKRSFKSTLAIKTINDTGSPTQLGHAILIHNQAMAAISNFHALYVTSQETAMAAANS